MRVLRTARALGLMFILVGSAAAVAQTTRIDPAPLPPDTSVTGPASPVPAPPMSPTTPIQTAPVDPATNAPPTAAVPDPGAGGPLGPCINPQGTHNASDPTYHKDDLIGAGEGVFGKGAKELAQVIERILKKQGEPNAYIAGREAGGAFIVGLRYGSGALCHKVEGQRPVYWNGPSVGFDAGGAAAKVFVLVYNLYDTQDLYRRYGEVEGQAFYIGGLSATYLRRGNIVLIPVRLGVGLRLGANVGYMKFREKNNWVPF